MILGIGAQKGGVGKSTLSINLSAFLAFQGYRTLLIDFDSQANCTSIYFNEPSPYSFINIIKDGMSLEQIITSSKYDKLGLIPSNISLAKLERLLIGDMDGVHKLRDVLEESGIINKYEYIICDSPPSLGVLTMNVFVASDFIIVPVECDKFAVDGLLDLEESITLVQKRPNPYVRILGAFINKYDQRKNLVRGIEKDIENHFGELLFNTRVRQTVKIAEAHTMKLPIFIYAKDSIGAQDMGNLCEEILQKSMKPSLLKEESKVTA